MLKRELAFITTPLSHYAAFAAPEGWLRDRGSGAERTTKPPPASAITALAGKTQPRETFCKIFSDSHDFI